jgi:hypothetical protein
LIPGPFVIPGEYTLRTDALLAIGATYRGSRRGAVDSEARQSTQNPRNTQSRAFSAGLCELSVNVVGVIAA